MEVVFSELSGFVNDEVDSIAARREQVMLEGRGAVVSVHDVAGLLVDAADPVGELPRIWDGGRQENMLHGFRQHDQTFLPHNTTLFEGGRKTSHLVAWKERRKKKKRKAPLSLM